MYKLTVLSVFAVCLVSVNCQFGFGGFGEFMMMNALMNPTGLSGGGPATDPFGDLFGGGANTQQQTMAPGGAASPLSLLASNNAAATNNNNNMMTAAAVGKLTL